MSATSAFATRRAVERVRTVVAIELLCAAQAAEFVDPSLAHGVGTGAAYEAIRELVPPLDDDRPPAPDIEAVDDLVASGALDARVERALRERAE
jgi:histidine ammonia-lyase